MTYQEFKSKYPVGSSIGKPFAPFDYKGECVSEMLQKAVLVDRAPFNSPIGHASQIPTNATFLKYYELVSTDMNSPKRQVGDMMFWGDDPGNWTGPEGHAAQYDGDGYMWNQNFLGSRKISRNRIFAPGFMGYYRIKVNGVEMADKTILTKLWVGYAAQYPAPDSYLNHWDGKPVTDVLDWLEKQPIHVDILKKSSDYQRVYDTAEDRLKSINTLVAQLKNSQAGKPVDTSAVDKAIKEAQEALDAAKALKK